MKRKVVVVIVTAATFLFIDVIILQKRIGGKWGIETKNFIGLHEK